MGLTCPKAASCLYGMGQTLHFCHSNKTLYKKGWHIKHSLPPLIEPGGTVSEQTATQAVCSPPLLSVKFPGVDWTGQVAGTWREGRDIAILLGTLALWDSHLVVAGAGRPFLEHQVSNSH